MPFDCAVLQKMREAIKERVFYVQDIHEISGNIIVVGIEDNYNIIKIGDVFATSYDIDWDLQEVNRNIFEENPESVDLIKKYLYPDRINSKNINLTVDTISFTFAPDIKVSELPSRYTGAITFTGHGMKAIHPGCFLATG